ncbi:MAG TPA: DUF5018 domain-containing protein [Tenuifilum sp.]|nr:DUF5018 domain-containing protein [Tenuifilum sp.]
MKSKILLTTLFVAIVAATFAQPLYWREDLYDPTKTSTITRDNSVKSEGDYSLKYVFTDDGTPYFICDTFAVTGGANYEFKIDYLDNDPACKISARLWFFSAPNTSYLERQTSGATTDSGDWQTITISGTAPAGATLAYVAIRMGTDAAWAGSGTFWADNARYFENGGTTNLIKNGGFEGWKVVENSTIKNWREDLYDPSKTSTITPELAKSTHGFYSVKYTFTDDGTPYFICDTFAVTGGATYEFNIDYLDNDPACKISARLWFFSAPNTSYLERKTSSATTDNADWQTITISGTAPAGATLAYVAIRMQTDAAWAGSGTFWADNARYFENGGTTNLIKNGSFEEWEAPTEPEFLTYKFEGLNPVVNGAIDKTAKTVTATVPFATDLTNLVASFTTNGATVKVNDVVQESGVTPNDFTNPITYKLELGSVNTNWVVTVSKAAPATGKDILSFRFEGLTPPVTGIINAAEHKVTAEVPFSTDLTTLVPTITVSQYATISPASGVAQNFTNPVTYTVTAQDGTTQAWEVTVTKAAEGRTTLLFEDFENKILIPSGWVLINGDGYTQAPGEERWQDSAWVVATTNRQELQGTQVAMASSYTSDMPMDGKAYDWMILPKVDLGNNTTIAWQAMSTTTSGNYPDDYMVVIAPAVDGVTPTISYFETEGNILLEVKPESWSQYVGRPGQGLATRSINLRNAKTVSAPDGWFNRPVWIAFVLITDLYVNPDTGIPNSSPGGSNLAVDNIHIYNDVLSGISDNAKNLLNTLVYPNPASEKATILVPTQLGGKVDVVVTDIVGRMVYSTSINATENQTRVNLETKDWGNGIYVVRTTYRGTTGINKLVVR